MHSPVEEQGRLDGNHGNVVVEELSEKGMIHSLYILRASEVSFVLFSRSGVLTCVRDFAPL